MLLALPPDPAISTLVFRVSLCRERGQILANAVSAQAANSGEWEKTREPGDCGSSFFKLDTIQERLLGIRPTPTVQRARRARL